MENWNLKITNEVTDLSFLTKEDESGFLSAAEDFISEQEELSSVDEFNSSVKEQEECSDLVDSSITSNTVPLNQIVIGDSQHSIEAIPSSIPLISKEKQIESTSTKKEGYQDSGDSSYFQNTYAESTENISENGISLIHEPILKTEIKTKCQDLNNNLSENYAKANEVVNEGIKHYHPSPTKSPTVEDNYPKTTSTPKPLQQDTSENNCEKNSNSTQSTQQHVSSINSEKCPSINIISEIKPQATKNAFSQTSNIQEFKNGTEEKSLKSEETTQGSTSVTISDEYSKLFTPTRPMLMKFTEGITGNVKELLICTSDTIVDVCQNNPSGQKNEIIQSLLKISKTYSGKPMHIIFNPRNLPEEEKPILLHPSPGRHNLLQSILPNEMKPKRHSCLTIVESNKSQAVLSSNGPLIVSDKPLTTNSPEKKKLRIRLCRRKKSRTSLKHIDARQVVSSVFGNIFHCNALSGGQLKSGSVITRSVSNFWLKKAGVAEDECSLETASDTFMELAGTKVVLNIFDYLKFLIVYARKRRLVISELVDQLTICKLPPPPSKQTYPIIEDYNFILPKRRQRNERFHSLPNL